MKILFPYTDDKVNPKALALLEEHAPDAVLHRIDPADYLAYARILCEAWLWEGDLLIVEHDIGIHDQVIPGFAECRQPWCGNPYLVGDSPLVALGCTRFTGHLKAMLPGAMAEAAAVGLEDGGGVPVGDWRRMDIRIGLVLEGHGHQRHWHQPLVEHYHTYAPAQGV